MQIITRAEAKELGLKYYFTGKPCKHGHCCQRTVNNNTCLACKKVSRAKWEVANKDKIYGYMTKWRLKNKDKTIAYSAKSRKLNPEKDKVRWRRYKRIGPINPQGESQWLSKSKALLRNIRRLLRHQGVLQLPTGG